MDEATEQLLFLLDLQPAEEGVFVGPPSEDDRFRVFGGQVLAQALAAACFTVEDLPCHSLNAYFLRPGKPGRPTEYEVSNMRDGQTFSMRQVIAMQRQEVNFQMVASFTRNEGELEHQLPMPEVPDPESFGSEDERIAKQLAKLPEDQEEMRAYLEMKRPIEIVPADGVDRFSKDPHDDPRRAIWMRVRSELPGDPNLHRCVLAYASDFMILDCCLMPLGVSYASKDMQIASIDHAIWFHRDFRFDDWLLFSYDSTATANGRGLGRGVVFTRDGKLVASMTQEGMMRRREA